MKFGPVPLADAEGGVLAHTLRHPRGVVKKGTVLGGEELAALREAGLDEVVVARLEAGDVDENEAAERLARAVAGPGLRVREPFTGRANVYAEERGLAVVDEGRIDAVNGVRESLTLATLRPFTRVEAGDLVATAKVIPFAVPGSLLERVETVAAGEEGPVLRVAPYEARRVGMILTELPGTKEKVLRRAEETMRVRVSALGSRLERVARCPHDVEAVARVLEEMLGSGLGPVLLLGASAVVDRGDVLPRAAEAVGGGVEHFGLPVDPGNLLLLAYRDDVPILGVPGCARSPKRSGFDLVLERLLAGLDVSSRDLMELGVGGLLKEIPTRPQPRAGTRGKARGGVARPPRVGAVVLAAGRSRRMGGENKLLSPVEEEPMVARAVDALLASPARPVVVVTGHEAERIREVLDGRAVRFAHNPGHEEGMGSSLRTGMEALEEEGGVDGVVICLADMPRVAPHHVAALVRAFDPRRGRTICVPVHERKRGHPVLFGARHFSELRQVAGDVGAREILARHDDAIVEVPVDDPGVLLDVDTREALDELEEWKEPAPE